MSAKPALSAHLLRATFGLTFAAFAGAAASPVLAQAVQVYEYQPEKLYPVHAALGITTQIELSPHEEILDYSSGFSNGWELTRRDTVFYLKPRNVDVDTNFMVRTKTHFYIFELKVVATDWKTLESARKRGVQYRIKFDYPPGTKFSDKVERAARPSELNTSLVKGRHYNFNYDYAARDAVPWLVPANVYDDGRFTYIRMSERRTFPSGNFPSVYMRQREHDADSLINTTVEDNTIVVHGTYPYLVLRHGTDVVGIRRNATP